MLNAELKKDCKILLERALLFKDLIAFGADGCGLHGTSYRPQTYQVMKIDVEVDTNEDGGTIGMAWITLGGYNSDDNGHICTDLNFKFSVNLNLRQEFIDPACWEYCEVHFQEPKAVVLKLDVFKLIG